MNQEDLGAAPMYDAFRAEPNFAPYTNQPNQIPLTPGAPGFPSTLSSVPGTLTAAEKKSFARQGAVPASMRSVYRAWMAWSKEQPFNGPDARVDAEKPALLNRLDWYSAHNWTVAYPGDPKIYTPNEVPGRNLPAAFLGHN